MQFYDLERTARLAPARRSLCGVGRWFGGELQAKAHDAGAEQRAKIDTAVTALKAQQTAYQEQMQKVRDASEAAFADLRTGSERMAEEFGKAYAQAAGRFAA